MIRFLKVLFAVMCVYMIYDVIVTSLKSNLFEELPGLLEIPWMVTTLIDFYFNIILIFVWVAYKETKVALKLLWLVLFVGLGSIATTFYMLVQLQRLQPGEGVRELLLKRNGVTA